ncbi:exported hypothetical protein [uncultured delta proteobacterium]|uniref:Lipoprotein n=1 Tax=uncultured delta proteobacterium TaxID=34034 RepID=A0A212IY34_9DELT|nr:exported hypothetical protein [uncultured delta proteobacterium]
MRKALFLLLAIAALASSCGGVARMPANEQLTGAFAYVVGKYGVGFQDITFSRNGDQDDANQIRLTSNSDYPVYKVSPGRYIATKFTDGAGSFTGRLGEFTAEAGKITYIGDIELRYGYDLPAASAPRSGRQGPVTMLRGRAAITATDNTEQAKAAIRKHYPGLAGNLDAIFVYSPVMPVR